MKAGHYDYARSLFREAALLYEKEADPEHYSICFYGSHTAEAKKSWAIFIQRGEEEKLVQEARWKDRWAALVRFVLNLFGRFTWGYGERPLRTLEPCTRNYFGKRLSLPSLRTNCLLRSNPAGGFLGSALSKRHHLHHRGFWRLSSPRMGPLDCSP